MESDDAMSTTHATPELQRRIALMGVWTLLSILAAGLIGAWPTRALASETGVVAMIAGLAVALGGAWASSLVTVQIARRGGQYMATGAMAGLGMRFMLTLGVAMIIMLAGTLPTKPFMLWVGIGQVVALTADVWSLARIAPLVTGEAKC